MVNFHLGLFFLSSVLVLVSGSSRNLPILSFDEGYSYLFGDDNLMVLKDGKSVHLSLNERTGPFLFSVFFFFFLFQLFFLLFEFFPLPKRKGENRLFLFKILMFSFIFFVGDFRLWICVTRPLSSRVFQCFY